MIFKGGADSEEVMIDGIVYMGTFVSLLFSRSKYLSLLSLDCLQQFNDIEKKKPKPNE